MFWEKIYQIAKHGPSRGAQGVFLHATDIAILDDGFVDTCQMPTANCAHRSFCFTACA